MTTPPASTPSREAIVQLITLMLRRLSSVRRSRGRLCSGFVAQFAVPITGRGGHLGFVGATGLRERWSARSRLDLLTNFVGHVTDRAVVCELPAHTLRFIARRTEAQPEPVTVTFNPDDPERQNI